LKRKGGRRKKYIYAASHGKWVGTGRVKDSEEADNKPVRQEKDE